ncbi:hypothetical protein ABZR86_13980 [Dyella marensis]|nr:MULTISPECIES: hypothetical protein [Dyella]
MKAVEVFTPGKIPTVTFVDDHLKRNEGLLRDALEQGGMLVSLSGPSKSGKTVFVKTVLGADYVVAVTGAGIQTSDELWDRVFHVLGTPLPKSVSQADQSGSKAGGQAKVGGDILVAKAEASGTIERSTTSTETYTADVATNRLALLITELAGTGITLFIDDFHYLGRALQDEVARQIKDAIASGVQIICASVPYRSEDVLRANPDLRGRVVGIDFDYWNDDTLQKIGELGFRELNAQPNSDLLRSFASEAAGSPQLMQALCLNACFEIGLRERAAKLVSLDDSNELFEAVCTRTSQSANYAGTLERLRDGPKKRGTDRNQYRLLGGDVGDVYTILLRAIALDPPNLHFRYAELVRRIGRVCENDTPVGSSVTGSCVHVAQLANDGQERDIIEWDAQEDALHIRDPYLLFFMRWG